ncbi:MAG: HAD family hydrolase [Oscillospiraceae bacterium]|nr:HAD family hydrolase [Oscillospiraceae bacterium]
MKYPKMIIFDYGHTLLWEPGWDPERGDRALFEHITRNPGGYSLEEIRKQAEIIFNDTRMSLRELGIEMSARTRDKVLYELLGIELSLTPLEMETVFWDGASPGDVMPGAAEMLDFINSKGIRSAVISNLTFSGEALKRRLDRLLPRNRFEFVMTSSDYMFRKPSKVLFDTAVRKSGLTPGEIWYCGDQPRKDVGGPHGAGIFPVWYDNGSIPGPGREIIADYAPPFEFLHIREWRGMTDVLETLEKENE